MRAESPDLLGSGPGPDCRRHCDALFGLLADPAGANLPAAARAHLDTCPSCHERCSELLLAGHAVRRAFADTPMAHASGDAWPRLRARIQRRSPTPGRASSPILGMALAAGLATSLLLPLGVVNLAVPHVRAPQAAIHEAGLDPAAILAAGRRDAEDEARRLRETARAGREAMSADDHGRGREAMLRYELATAADARSSTPRPSPAWVE